MVKYLMHFTNHSFCNYRFYLTFENETRFIIKFMPGEAIEEDKMRKDNFQSYSRENGFRFFFLQTEDFFSKTTIRNIWLKKKSTA